MFVAAVSNCLVFACWVCAVCRSAVHWLRSDFNFIFLFYICSPLHFTWIRCVLFLRAAKVHRNTICIISIQWCLCSWSNGLLRVKKRHTKAKKKKHIARKAKERCTKCAWSWKPDDTLKSRESPHAFFSLKLKTGNSLCKRSPSRTNTIQI